MWGALNDGIQPVRSDGVGSAGVVHLAYSFRKMDEKWTRNVAQGCFCKFGGQNPTRMLHP